MRELVRCDRCGTEGEWSLLWSREVDADGTPALLCPECTRAHVRAIEARLDREWW